jgi:aminopeptidase N
LSEPFGAKDWWPCKQSLNDKVDSLDIYLTCPSQYRDGSNGVLVSEVQNGSNTTYHWQTHYPIAAYLIAIAVTNYAYYSNYVPMSSGDSLQVLNYVFPEDLSYAQASTLPSFKSSSFMIHLRSIILLQKKNMAIANLAGVEEWNIKQ